MDKIIHKELSYKLNGLCMKAHNELGRFCKEKQYLDKLVDFLDKEGLEYKRETEIKNIRSDSPKSNRPDLIIENKIILDAKTKKFITKEDYNQMQRYLKGANLELGLIVNFRNTYLKPKRVLNSGFSGYKKDHKNSDHSDVNSGHSDRPKGFTLIELIIYLAVTTIILIASLSFAWTIINDQTKQENLSEVNNTGRFILDKITYSAKRGDSLGGATVYNTNPGALVVNYVTNPQITIDTYDKQITLGDSTFTIKKLRLKRGSDPAIDLTSDKINVSNFVIIDSSNANAVTINIDLTLSAVNPSGTKAYEAENSWTTSITVRKRQ